MQDKKPLLHSGDSPQRKIIHIDMDAFFASVEQRDFPEYRGKPLVVGGSPEKRGVIAAASYEARQFGIRSAMPAAQAIMLCPKIIFTPPRFDAYKTCSEQIHNIFQRYTATIEPLSLDEAFLDVTGSKLCQGSATLIAQEIKRSIKEELNLTASAGVSYCKFLAKIASDLNKPDGLALIKPEEAEAFIAALPIRKFFGIGKATEAKMNELGIFNGNDLKQWTREQLQKKFGKQGNFYYEIVRGIDNRPVRTHRERKSIGKETTFAKDIVDQTEMENILETLAEKVINLLNGKKLQALTLTLKVKYSDFHQITRSQTVDPVEPIITVEHIYRLLPELITKTEMGTRPVRLLGISLSNFTTGEVVAHKPADQLELFPKPDQ